MKPPLTRGTRIVISTNRVATIRFQLANFSTSHNYVYRRQEEARNVRVSVWWDVESCSLPVGGSGGYRIVHSITSALRANGIKGPLQISAFGNVSKIPKGTQEALSSTGITLVHLPGGKEKDSVNRSIIIELMYWVSQHPPPAHIFLISGDHDMASVLHRLRMSNYNILLAGPEDASVALCSAASIMWHWNELVKGENLVGKYFNQLPDGPNGSWYGAYKVPLESPLPAVEEPLTAIEKPLPTIEKPLPTVEKPLPVRDIEPVESEIEKSVQDIPPELIEQIRRILISYPDGVSITTLREELGANFIVDKNMYGYKKFSSLLLAMPQILELQTRKYGQHLVRAVNYNTPVSIDPPMKESENSRADETDRGNFPTQIEVCDDKSSLKSAEELCTLNSLPVTNKKSKQTELDPQSSPICNEQPLSKEGCEGLRTNDKDAELGSDSCSAPTEKPENACEVGVFRRTWTKWFGDANKDAAGKREGNYLVQHGPSSDYTCPDTASNENAGGLGKILKFCGVLYGFKTDSIGSESADAGSYSTNVPNLVAQHSFRNDAFSKDDFWTEMKAFMCSPKGVNVVSKSTSRQQMSQELKKEGPSALSLFGDDDLLRLVDLLIDNRKWVKECLSKTSPFKFIYASGDLLENYSDSNAKSSIISDEMQQTDLRNDKECGIGSTNQFSSPIKSRMLADCQKLVDGIVKTHPKGYSLSGFKKLFFERYNYCLRLRHLGFDKLTSLINTMSGVRLKGDVIYPSESNPSFTPGSLDTDIIDDMNRTKQMESDNEISIPSTDSDIFDSQFDEQLGPVRSLNKNPPSSLSGNLKQKKDLLLQYEPCSEEDICTDSDGETRTKEGRPKVEVPKVHKEVSTLIDILSNWEAKRDVASKSNNLSETAPKDNIHDPIKGDSPAEVSRKTSRITAHKWKSPRTYNFVSDDHKNKVELKDTTEPRQQC